MTYLFPDSKKYARTRGRLATIGVTVAVGLLTASAASAEAIKIDPFTEGPGVVTFLSIPESQTFIAANALGGQRTLAVTQSAGSNAIVIGDGLLGVNATGNGPTMASVTYVTSPFDLTMGATANSFRLEIFSIDLGFVDLSMKVSSASGMVTSITKTRTPLDFMTSPVEFKFDTTDFPGSVTDIFRNATEIVLNIGTDTETDVRMFFVGISLPGQTELAEPLSVALFGLGLMAAGVAARRRA